MPYALGAVKDHVRAAADTIGPKFGITNVLGVGLRPNESDHPKGLALDFMTTDKAKGDALAEHVKTNASAYGVKYIIWWGRIWSVERNAEGWRAYTGRSPHKDHVHVSFNAQPGTGVPTQNETGTGGIGCLILLMTGYATAINGIAYAVKHWIGG